MGKIAPKSVKSAVSKLKSIGGTAARVAGGIAKVAGKAKLATALTGVGAVVTAGTLAYKGIKALKERAAKKKREGQKVTVTTQIRNAYKRRARLKLRRGNLKGAVKDLRAARFMYS